MTTTSARTTGARLRRPPEGAAGRVRAGRPAPRQRRRPRGKLLPWHLDTQTMNAACTVNPSHEWGPQHFSWNDGAMDRWVIAHTSADGPAAAPQVMGYYTRQDLPLYYALADAFTLCDNYHCSVLAPSDPNHHYGMAATLDPDGVAGGPVVTNAPSVAAVPPSTVATNAARYSWTTMPERLQSQGVSWKVYQAPGSLASTPLTNNILITYQQFADPSSALYQNAFAPTYPADFVADIAAGTLPSVSWVYAPPMHDEHPPAPSNTGARVTGQILQALLRNPKVWAQTVMFVLWDENGGFFDHVAPHRAARHPRRVPDHRDAADHRRRDQRPHRSRVRVPLLVLSPFSRGGHINSDVADHTSPLRFLETRFGVEVPNLSAWRRSVTSDLTSTLDLLPRPNLHVPPLPIQGLSDREVSRERFVGTRRRPTCSTSPPRARSGRWSRPPTRWS